jgi:phage shock protein E
LEKATIVDVRTPNEYRRGHAKGSVNIPLQEIGQRLEEVRALRQPVVLCCASGARSANAAEFLKTSGIECVDGGSWLNVNNQR